MPAAWVEVRSLIETGKAKSYDQATALLADLRDLAAMKDSATEFSRRLQGLCKSYGSKHALMRRFSERNLC